MKSNGEILKYLRSKAEISQKEMAERLGLKQSTYSNYENNYNNPPISVIREFCEILDVDVDNFQIVAKDHSDCKVMDSDFRSVRKMVNSINDKRLRRKLIFEFGNLMEDFKERIETEVEHGEK